MKADADIPRKRAGGPLGDILRTWRRSRGMSQLDLALAVGMSARHLSFIESGRARPSRDMAHALAGALAMPRGDHNALLTAAGFAAVYPSTPLQAAALAPFRAMLDQMMANHAPNPALLCDRRWNVLDASASARVLLTALGGESGGTNIIRLLAESPAARAMIENHADVLAEMHERIRLETLEAGADAELRDLLRALETALATYAAQPAAPRSPMVPVIIRSPAGRLSFLSAVAHFGTSEDVTVRDMRLELLFPADDETRAAISALG